MVCAHIPIPTIAKYATTNKRMPPPVPFHEILTPNVARGQPRLLPSHKTMAKTANSMMALASSFSLLASLTKIPCMSLKIRK